MVLLIFQQYYRLGVLPLVFLSIPSSYKDLFGAVQPELKGDLFRFEGGNDDGEDISLSEEKLGQQARAA